ncbi:hypothetical protein CRENBAI_010612 [Crenichthys baileyi]|uniref:Uncharacterized protein n=1 Tax=Crenichthys baileyi TaxID=28760 RepID=A0AAV9QWT6_9TELE
MKTKAKDNNDHEEEKEEGEVNDEREDYSGGGGWDCDVDVDDCDRNDRDTEDVGEQQSDATRLAKEQVKEEEEEGPDDVPVEEEEEEERRTLRMSWFLTTALTTPPPQTGLQTLTETMSRVLKRSATTSTRSSWQQTGRSRCGLPEEEEGQNYKGYAALLGSGRCPAVELRRLPLHVIYMVNLYRPDPAFHLLGQINGGRPCHRQPGHKKAAGEQSDLHDECGCLLPY